MYLARYRNGASAIIQAAFRIEAKLAHLPDFHDEWRKGFLRIGEELIGSDKADLAFRVVLREGVLERVLVCTAEEAEQKSLEQVGRSLEGLNNLVADSVQSCANRKTHDEMLGWFPPVRAWNSSQPYPYKDFQLGQKFLFFSALDRLLIQAARSHWRFAWQANLRRFRPSREDVRAVRKNLVRVEGAGLPAKVRSYQEEIASGLESAHYLIDEFIGFDDGTARQAATPVVEACFRDKIGPFGFTAAPLVWDEGEQFDEFLYAGLHSSLLAEPEPMAKASGCLDAASARALLSWKPPVTRPEPAVQQPTATPLANGKPDVFISYSSKDVETARLVCAALERDGWLRCWMAPRDIPPGANWSAAIIEGIEASRVMVLVFSRNSNDSPQVLREVERAVSKRLRVIPLRLERLSPCKELEYYLSAVHWVDVSSASLATHLQQLRQSIRGWVGAVPPVSSPSQPQVPPKPGTGE